MTVELIEALLDGNESDLNTDVDMVMSDLDRTATSCQAVIHMEKHGTDPLVTGMLRRSGLLSGVSVGMSTEGLGGLVDDAAKVAAHGAAGRAGDLGAKILKHATSVERGVLAQEKLLLREIMAAQKAGFGKISHAEKTTFNTVKFSGGSRSDAVAKSLHAGDEAARALLHDFKLNEAERAIYDRAGNPSDALMGIFRSRISDQRKVVREAERALKAAQESRGGVGAIGTAQEKLTNAKAVEDDLVKKAGSVKSIAQKAFATTKDAISESGASTGKLSAKNAIIALTAVTAVATGLAMLFRSMPAAGATAEAKNSYFSKVVSWVKSIHLPWAKLDVNDAGKLMCNGKPVKSAVHAAEDAASSAMVKGDAGWTKSLLDQVSSKVHGVGQSISSAFTGLAGQFGHLSGAGEAASHAAESQMAPAGKAASLFAKSSRMAMVFALIALVASVIYFVVIGGMRLVRKSVAN